MMHRSSLLLSATLLAALAGPARANDLRVETRRVWRPDGAAALRVDATVSWKNAWRTARNHDAAWLVVKLRGAPNRPWSHASIVSVAAASATPAARCAVSGDRVGASAPRPPRTAATSPGSSQSTWTLPA